MIQRQHPGNHGLRHRMIDRSGLDTEQHIRFRAARDVKVVVTDTKVHRCYQFFKAGEESPSYSAHPSKQSR